MPPSQLKWAGNTGNFESAAKKVFQRLIHGKGPGLLVLWGGWTSGPKANKTEFFKMIEAFEKGAASEEDYLSTKFPALWELLAQLKAGQYQCIRVKEALERVTPSKNDPYKIPLAVAVSYAVGFAGYSKGLMPWRRVVILCDDIEKFMRFNSPANEEFLRDMAQQLDNQTAVTFLGASQTIWSAHMLGDQRVVPLRGD